jgi:drug/metabolite transporter superfamily protein YnfA
MKKRDTNYRGLFLVGLSLIVVGTSLISLQPKPVGTVLISIGGLFIIIALRNKKDWK